MTDEPNSMGPVDFIVVEFPDGHTTGEALARLVDLVDGGVVRILDLVFLRKDDAGTVSGIQIADLDGDGTLDLQVLEGASSGLLGADDLGDVGEVIAPGSAAAAVVYENLWAVPFATALRRAGAELVASGRLPAQELLATIDAVESGVPADV
jgi:hypothetical protein